MKEKTIGTLSPFDAKIHHMGRLSTVIVWYSSFWCPPLYVWPFN